MSQMRVLKQLSWDSFLQFMSKECEDKERNM